MFFQKSLGSSFSLAGNTKWLNIALLQIGMLSNKDAHIFFKKNLVFIEIHYKIDDIDLTFSYCRKSNET